MDAPIRKAVTRIEKDRERGASLLAEDALATLADAWARADGATGVDVARAVAPVARSLRSARPSMPVVANVVNLAMHRAVAALPDGAGDARAAGAAVADAVHEEAVRARGNAARRAAEIATGTVFTLSASETVLKALRAAARAGRLRRVIAAESRPGFEGRELARALADAGVDVTLIVDAAVGLHVGEADAVIVGADAVLPDGGVVNKVGTYPCALVAREAGVPFHAVADAFKVSAVDRLPLEEKAAREVLPRDATGLAARNIYFDRTPPTLVTGIVTDAGVLAPGDVRPRAEDAAAWAGWPARLRRHAA